MPSWKHCLNRLNKYLHEHGCEWSHTIIDHALRISSIKILQYLRKNGCPHTMDRCYEFAAWENMDNLKCWRGAGFDWDEWIILRAT